MKVEKIYGVGSNIQVSFTQATVSDTVKIASLGQEKADVVVTEKKPIVQYYVAPRCNGKSFTQLVKEMKKDAVLEPFIDASVIKGTSDLRPIVIDASEIKAPIGTIITMSEPKKIIRSGEYTTVLWMDGTKTIVKRMPGSEDSDYAAFTAALAKKVYGTNSKVERIVSMTERVKTKAEKKAEKKAKKSREKYVKTETTEPEKTWYIVKKNGIIVDRFLDGDAPFFEQDDSKLWVYASSEEEARKKAIEAFVKTNKIYFVNYKWSAFVSSDFSETCYADFDKEWGVWKPYIYLHTYVFANFEEEAVQLAKEIPRE